MAPRNIGMSRPRPPDQGLRGSYGVAHPHAPGQVPTRTGGLCQQHMADVVALLSSGSHATWMPHEFWCPPRRFETSERGFTSIARYSVYEGKARGGSLTARVWAFPSAQRREACHRSNSLWGSLILLTPQGRASSGSCVWCASHMLYTCGTAPPFQMGMYLFGPLQLTWLRSPRSASPRATPKQAIHYRR